MSKKKWHNVGRLCVILKSRHKFRKKWQNVGRHRFIFLTLTFVFQRTTKFQLLYFGCIFLDHNIVSPKLAFLVNFPQCKFKKNKLHYFGCIFLDQNTVSPNLALYVIWPTLCHFERTTLSQKKMTQCRPT
jgi:hypothetical protein